MLAIEDEHTPVVTERGERVAKLAGDFGDYELLEEIGRGGQGIVYLARQKSLNRTVALKVITPGQWASGAHLKRFRREAQTAASLDHPNIVSIYDVGEHDGSCYFSMKFVEGGQLDEVVSRVPMSIRQAVEMIAKLSRTVHYAHQHGILHRDIKPGNILLDTGGEPHLADFGLARLVEAERTVTRTEEMMGTPSYMAPEQVVGSNAQLTSATDVYGLGAVLYQLLTGHLPFAADTAYETIRLLLETEPREPRLLNPKLDHELSTICLKCLEKDPKRRYPSALALAEDLEHWLKHEPILALRHGIFTRGRKWVRRQPAIAALVASSVALAAVISWDLWKSEFFQPPITNGIAVLPFENLSADPANAYFAEGIQDEILTRLTNISSLKVISRTSTQRYQSKPVNLAEIARQLGVANILEGSVQKVADQVRVNVQLINAQTDSHIWAETYDRKLTDTFDIESEIAKGVAESLQAKLTGHEEQALAVKPTNNTDAYDAYLRGLAFETRSYFTYSSDLVRKATGSYERAVQLDPNFALAWARLSRANANLYFGRGAETTSARRDAAKSALEHAQKLEPDSPQTLLALGYYQYWVLRDYGPAKTTFGRVSEMLPSSSEVPYALALVTRREGQWDQSIAYFKRALAVDPRYVPLLMDSAETCAMHREFPEALKLYDRALDITPNDPDAMGAKASIYQAQGNLQGAAKLLVDVNARTPAQFLFETKIVQLRLERNLGEAVRLLQARLAQFHFASQDEKAGEQVFFALTQHVAGDTAGAKITAEQARNTFEHLYRDQSNNLQTRAPRARADLALQLSLAYAVIGERDSAIRTAERAIMLLPRANDAAAGPVYEENMALIETIVGENSPAIPAFTQLLQTAYSSWYYGPAPITPALLRLDPIWDSLRADPAFQKLCDEKEP
jgi:serine/threonine protein kinase/Tfp pilus assembly protein PilF